MCCLLDAFCCILMSRHMLRHWTVYSWWLDKNYTLALRILEQRSGGRVAAKIDCARPCFFHLPSFKMPMQWHHYERFSSATIPRTKETTCPRSEDAKVYKVDVQKRDIYQTFIYLFYYLLHVTVWWRVEKPQALKDVGGMYVCTIYLSAIYVN